MGPQTINTKKSLKSGTHEANSAKKACPSVSGVAKKKVDGC